MTDMSITSRCKTMHEYIDLHKDDMIVTLEKLVTMESGTKDDEDVNTLGNYLCKLFTNEGFECELIDVGSGGKTLVGMLGKERGGKPIIFTGHMDTVFGKGTINENPFRIENGKAYGPGVLDMKSGIVISYYVIKALNAVGFDNKPIKILFSGNEECIHENLIHINLIPFLIVLFSLKLLGLLVLRCLSNLLCNINLSCSIFSTSGHNSNNSTPILLLIAIVLVPIQS
ncbi:MAG: hypothetical protein ACI8WT_004681 [Clostridium sp.]|jgi:hypothetical protein